MVCAGAAGPGSASFGFHDVCITFSFKKNTSSVIRLVSKYAAQHISEQKIDYHLKERREKIIS